MTSLRTGGLAGHPTMMGRDEELRVIDDVADDVWGPPETSVLRAVELSGEPGIGKSCLLAGWRDRLAARGVRVLEARASESQRVVAFGVLVDAVEDELGRLSRLGWRPPLDASSLDMCGSLFPALATGPVSSPTGHRLLRALRMLLDGMALRSRTALVVDDAHWADEASAELLGYLVRRPVAAPTLLVIAHRPRQASTRLVAELGRGVDAGTVRRVRLDPLSRRDVGRLLAARGVAAERHDGLYEASGGNPFYLDALERAGPRPADAMAALRAELTGLDGVALRVAGAAAVLGDQFDPRVAERMSGLPTAGFRRGLETLLAADVLRCPAEAARVSFRHPLVLAAVYESLTPAERVAGHAAAAAAYTEDAAPVELRAEHLQHCARRGDEAAITVLVDAAGRAMGRVPAAAADWLRAAVDLLPDTPDHAQRRQGLLFARSRAVALAGDLLGAREILDEVLAVSSDDLALRTAVVGLGTRMDRLLGRVEQASAFARRELEALPDDTTPHGAELRLSVVTAKLLAVPVDESDTRLIHEALRIAERHGLRGLRAEVCAALGLHHVLRLDLAEGRRWTDTAIDLVDGLSDAEAAERNLQPLVWVAFCAMVLDRPDEALRHVERVLAIARDTGQQHAASRMLAFRVRYLRCLGRLRDLDEPAIEAVDAAMILPSPEIQARALAEYSMVALLRGQPQAALRAAARAASTRLGMRFTGQQVALAHASAIAATDGTGAFELLLDAVGGPPAPLVDPVLRPCFHEALCRLAVEDGHPDRAAEFAAHAREAAAPDLPTHTALATRAEARALLARRDPDAAEHAERSAELFLRAKAPHEAADAWLLAARAHTPTSVDAARAALTKAIRLAEDCGALATLAQAHQWGRRLSTPGGAATDGLTAREREIAALAADGRSNRDIARALHISTRTVETHLAHVFDKLGLHTRAALAARWGRGTDAPSP
ncbi:ATP-binding protein [Actinosynnema sp. CS-041913]|uniref:ATP-binding protein n=1 Tax=Actinosynnema sp. CS-041913 TaxID=3239917 RepID=UPI003D8BF5A5